MKNLIALLLLSLCTAFAADNQYVAGIVVTNQPADADSLTVNGATMTFKSSVTTPSTQVAIGATTSDTANNLLSHIVNYPLTGISPAALNGTNIYLVGDVLNFVITASKVGSWGTLTVTPNSIVIRPMILPLSAVTPLTFRTNLANWTVLGLRDYTGTNFPAGIPLFTNYVDVSSPKNITASWLSSGAVIFSNILQRWDGGDLTNAWAKKIFLKNDGAHPNGIMLYNISAVRAGIAAPDASGFLTHYDGSGGETPSTPFGTTALATTSGTYLWRALADGRYGQLQATNYWTGTSNWFTTLLRAENFQGIITNTTGGFTNVYWSGALSGSGFLEISNAAPTIYLSETGQTADKGRWRMKVDNKVLEIDQLTDAGAVAYTPFSINYNVTPPTVAIAGFFADGNASIDQTLTVNGSSQLFGKVYVGANAAPTDATGITLGLGLLTSSTTASADPAFGTAFWTYGGEAFYRTPTTSEGGGQNNRIHNRGEQSFGGGSAYSLTTSYAEVTFGSTFRVVLPSAGTYLLQAALAVDADATTGLDSILGKFRNFSDSTDVTSSERTIAYVPNGKRGQLVLQNIITVSASKDIRVHAKNATSARGSIASTESSISYVRLY
jgi:hypothetical protein